MLRIFTLGILLFLTATFGYLLLKPLEQAGKPNPAIGGEFTLTSHTGEIITNDSLKGAPRLVYFGFTYCPDICPAGLATLQTALEKMRDEAPQAFFITVDPERDTQEQLALYMQNFPAITGLTGTPEQIKQAAKAYRIYYKKVTPKDSAADEYTMDHTSLIYLMDKNGHYLAHFPHSIAPQELVARIRNVLAR